MTGKEAAVRAQCSLGRAKHILPILVVSKRLIKTPRGYTLPIAGPAEGDLKIENIVLVAKTRKPQHLARPRGARRVSQTTLEDLERQAGLHGPERIEWHGFFRIWAVYVQSFANGTMTLQAGARGGPSMDFETFLEFAGWVQGSYPDIADSGPIGWHVSNWEFNRDFPALRLDGATAMSFKAFKNALIKFYQKESGLRVEVRVHHASKDVSLRSATTFAAEVVRRMAELGLIEVVEVKENEP